MRLLVTGSRNWRNTNRLWLCLDSLAEALARFHKEQFIREGLILVSGHARQGVDRMAEDWYADRFPLETPELWPANWKTGRSAGIKRNITMVDTHPDLCVAFIALCDKTNCHIDGLHGSHGATQCSDYAEASGIKVSRYYEGVPHATGWPQVKAEAQAIITAKEKEKP